MVRVMEGMDGVDDWLELIDLLECSGAKLIQYNNTFNWFYQFHELTKLSYSNV